MSAADTLRQAADRLATIAGAADPRGEWYTADALTALGIPAEDAALIALMTPQVALLLAEHLLDAAIDYAITLGQLRPQRGRQPLHPTRPDHPGGAVSGEERAHVVEAALGDRWHRCEVCGAEGRQPPPPAAELADAIRAWVRAQLVDDGGLLDRIRVEARIAALQDAADVADASAITGLEQTRPGLVAIWLRKRAEALGASRELRDGGGEDVALPDAGMHEVIMWAVAAVLPVIAAREARIRAEVRDAD